LEHTGFFLGVEAKSWEEKRRKTIRGRKKKYGHFNLEDTGSVFLRNTGIQCDSPQDHNRQLGKLTHDVKIQALSLLFI
jgi:hypothetical protein